MEFKDTLYRGNTNSYPVEQILENETAPEDAIVAMPGEETKTADERFARYDSDPDFRATINRHAESEEARLDEPWFDTREALVEEWRRTNPEVDGILYENQASKETRGAKNKNAFIAFRSEQIKSLYNEGTFAADNPDIRKQEVAEPRQLVSDVLRGTLAQTKRTVAALNEIDAFQKEMAREVAKVGITDPVKELGFHDVPALKTAALAALDKALASEVAAPEGPLFPEDIRIDSGDFTDAERAEAEETFRKLVSSMKQKAGNRFAAARDFLANNTVGGATEARRKRIDEIMATLTQAKEQHRLALREIMDQAQRLIHKGIPGEVEAAEKESASRAILEQLDKDAARLFTTDRAQKIIDSLPVNELSLESIFKAVFDLEARNDISLADTPVSTVRKLVLEAAETNPALQPLVEIGEGPDAKIRGTALLSALLGFIKKDAMLADAIRLRITQGTRAAETQNMLRSAYREENETRLREIAANAKGALKVPGNRAIAKLVDELDSLRAIERDRKRFERVNKSASFVKPLLDEALAKVEARQQVGYDAHMQYFTFDEAGAPVARPVTDLYDGAVPNAKRVRAARKAIEAWLDTRKPEGREYFTALDMVSELKRHEIEQVQEVRTSIYSRLAEDLVRQLRGIGLPEADAVANMVVRNENIKRGYIAQIRALGAPVDAAKVRFAEALGGARAYPTVDAAFVRAKALMQQPELDQKDGLAVVRRDFERDVRFVEIATNPKIWSLFEAWVKSSDKANLMVEEILRRYGTRVADAVSDENPLEDGKEEPLLRGYIPRAGYAGGTYATTYSQQAREVANYLGGKGRLEEIKNLREIINQDPAAALGGIEKFFSDDYLLKHFVTPLVNNPRPSIPAPVGPDGIKLTVDPSNARAAWDKADGSIVKFADEILLQGGYPTDPEFSFNYRKQIIQFFANRATRLATEAGTKSEGQMIATGVVDGFAVDARINHNEPPEWRSPVQMGTQDLRNIIHSIAAQEAYGREGRRLNKLVDSLNTKLHEAKRIVTENGSEFAALSKADKDKHILWTELYETRWGNTDVIKAIVKETNPENSSVGHLPFVQDMFGAAVAAMLANVRSAVTDLSSFMRPLFFERSLELETLGRVAKQAKNYARGGLFSAFEAITGMKVQKDEIDSLIEKAMGGSTANSYRMVDALTGKVSPGADNRLIAKPTDRFVHKASLVAHRRVFLPIKEILTYGGLGRSTGSNIRARINPFAWSSEIQSVGSLRTYLEAVQRYAQIGAEWLKQNPGGDLLDSPLGKKSVAFRSVYAALGNAGVNLQALAEKVAKALGKTAFDFMTAEDVHAVNGVIQDNIILESGPGTRPRALRESSVGRLAGTLVGWSLGASVQAADLLRTPEGRFNYASILRGTGVALAAIVPLSIGFSYLLDFYDDELLGKKRDQRRLQGDPEEMARAVLDRTVALGSFGIAGEVANYVTNNDEGAGRKILSVDQRVVPISMALATLKALGNISSVGPTNTTYAENWRPLFMAMGGSGLYQNIQLVNNLMGDPFEDEAGINQRINAQNYLRIGAREIGIPRPKRGGAEYTMDPLTPAIGEMYRAAMRDDAEAFQRAYKRAIKMAEKLPNQPDPFKVVKDRFSDRNILRNTVGSLGTDDVAMILDRLPPEGRQAIIDQVKLHNRYAAALGIKPYFGTERESSTLTMRRAQRATGAEEPTREAIARAAAAAARMRDTSL